MVEQHFTVLVTVSTPEVSEDTPAWDKGEVASVIAGDYFGSKFTVEEVHETTKEDERGTG